MDRNAVMGQMGELDGIGEKWGRGNLICHEGLFYLQVAAVRTAGH